MMAAENQSSSCRSTFWRGAKSFGKTDQLRRIIRFENFQLDTLTFVRNLDIREPSFLIRTV